MKIYLGFLLCMLAAFLFAQDTTYLDQNRVRIEDAALAHYYQVTENNVKGENTRLVRIYDMSGQIRLKKNMKKPGPDKKTEKRPLVRETINYEKMYDRDLFVLDGEVFTWWKNGQLRRHDIFEQYELIEGQCWDEQGNETEHYPFLIQPSFPGGIDKLMAFLNRNLRYPPRARSRSITGTVFVNFIVERDGSISEARVVSNTHRLLNNEALRVVESMPDWEPGFEDDFPIRVSFNLPIRFLLN
jgi:protein TonB